ncbi:hypothetical protein NC797_16220 [Aquibacillus sp. 3ASR75-11]|uniref:Uncharacterized protein n=1 Tax=Terrihalobacillus insolitus TaxID=2950438 RepID=A0A9X3WUK0_9BACI|nr:hypothetical protein [Terrihalobacillus insolitus]MDC3414488.1 hypothetical protein [Terrihalobacillus insolitus]MDC3426047.1 hypothetical protein [Terrihalobacillus insolitus]
MKGKENIDFKEITKSSFVLVGCSAAGKWDGDYPTPETFLAKDVGEVNKKMGEIIWLKD